MITTNFEKVLDFHDALGVPAPESPTIPPPDRVGLRVTLIEEEWNELARAMRQKDMVEIADGLADLLVVVYGTAAEYGIDIDQIFAEVHRTNMAKQGGPVREDGKVMKPEGWQPPRIVEFLKLQGWEG